MSSGFDGQDGICDDPGMFSDNLQTTVPDMYERGWWDSLTRHHGDGDYSKMKIPFETTDNLFSSKSGRLCKFVHYR